MFIDLTPPLTVLFADETNILFTGNSKETLVTKISEDGHSL